MKIVGAIFEKMKILNFLCELPVILRVHQKQIKNKRYGHTAHTFSRLMLNVIIWERFIFYTQWISYDW